MSKALATRQLQDLFEKEYVLFTPHATTAIYYYLKNFLKAGSRIAIPANVCPIVWHAITESGHVPCFTDIDTLFRMDLAQLRNIPDDALDCVMNPYIYGHSSDAMAFRKLCEEKGWVFLEDVAQALGAKSGEGRVGSFSETSFFSFGSGKVIDLGSGGGLATNNKDVYERVLEIMRLTSQLEDAKFSQRYYQESYLALVSGVPMSSEMQKGFVRTFLCAENFDENYWTRLSNELGGLDAAIEQRSVHARQMRDALKSSSVKIVEAPPGSVYVRQSILCEDRARVSEQLTKKNIRHSTYYADISKGHRTLGSISTAPVLCNKVVNFWVGHRMNEVNLEETLKAMRALD